MTRFMDTRNIGWRTHPERRPWKSNQPRQFFDTRFSQHGDYPFDYKPRFDYQPQKYRNTPNQQNRHKFRQGYNQGGYRGQKYNQQAPRSRKPNRQQHFKYRNDNGEQTTNNRAKNTPEYAEFCLLVRKMYNLIRAVHHLNKVGRASDSKSEPPTITRLTTYLSEVMKPANMTEDTRLLLEGNARNWAHTTRLILRDHYKLQIREARQTWQNSLPDDWREPFQVAARWARRHFGKRIDGDAVEQVEALFVTLEERRGLNTTPRPQRDRDDSETRLTREDGALFSEEDFPPLSRPGDTSSPLIPLIAPLSGLSTPSPALPKPQRQRVSRRSSANPAVAERDNFPELSHIQEGPTLSQAAATSTPRLIDEPSVHYDPQLVVHSHTSTTAGDDLEVIDEATISETGASPQGDNHTSQPIVMEAPVEEQDLLVSLHEEGREPAQPPSLVPVPSVNTPPLRPRIRPIRHLSTIRKMIDWTLTVRKKYLIVGDSNLSRIPDFEIEDLQIDSYPGANFRHAEAILSKTKVLAQVERVVLAFGLNNRTQQFRVTAIKQMQRALKMAKTMFPQARIWIPLINFSRSLKLQEQLTLTAMNDHIQKHITHIPLLPAQRFLVESDGIHWTPATARAMLEHWSVYLNL